MENQQLLKPTALLSHTWKIYKTKFWTLLGIIFLPTILSLTVTANTYPHLYSALSQSLPLMGLYGLELFISLWAGVALIYAIEEKIGIIESYRRSWKKIISFLYIYILYIVIIGASSLLIVPGIIFSVWFSFWFFVLVGENIKGMDALMKSKYYVQGRWWSVFWRLVLILSPSLLLGAVGTLGKADNNSFTGFDCLLFLLLGVIGPFITVYLFLIYKNLKETRGTVEFKNKGKSWFIAITIFGMFMIFIGFINFNPVSNSSLKTAKDAKIMSYMEQVKESLYIYHNKGSSYLGLETDPGYSIFCQKIAEINKSGCQAQASKDSFCVKTELNNKREKTSYSRREDYWCIDNSGVSIVIDGNDRCTSEKPYCIEPSSSPAY